MQVDAHGESTVGANALGGQVSVVIPSYNRAACLPATLDSIFSQTVPVKEVFLIDDGSTDETPSVVKDWEGKHPEWQSRFRYIRQENQGKSVALNAGLRLATGQWIAYNDSDDLWLPEKLALQAEALRKYPNAGACFTDARFSHNPEMNFTALARVASSLASGMGMIDNAAEFALLARSCIYMQTVLVRKEVMDQVGLFDSRFRVSQDTDFIFRLSLVCRLCYVNVPLVEIDRRPDRKDGLTKDYSRKTLVRLKTQETIFEKWLQLCTESAPKLVPNVQVLLRNNRSAQANLMLQMGDVPGAKQCLRDEISRNFSPRLILKYLWITLFSRASVRHAMKS